MAAIIGTGGPDTLRGTAGGDLVLGLDGADYIVGREGDDAILAGPGDDQIGGDNVPQPGGPFGSEDFGPLPRQLGGTPGDNLIFAGPGNDAVTAGFGADTVFGGSGDDRILGYGAIAISPTGAQGVIAADGPDLLFGEQGDDSIAGGGGDDLLNGGAGEDTLFGGLGVDTLVGGAGGDLFLFERNPNIFALDTGVGPGNRDVVVDFHEGADRLDLSGYRNFFPPAGGQPPPVFLGTDPFEASFALQVRYEIKGDNTVVQFVAPLGSPPPDTPPTVPSGPSGEIELVGVHHLTENAFILG